jgi:hypothetical protein
MRKIRKIQGNKGSWVTILFLFNIYFPYPPFFFFFRFYAWKFHSCQNTVPLLRRSLLELLLVVRDSELVAVLL